MSAHWVEVWSPGLQAVGGIVQFVGAIVFAFQWRIALRDTTLFRELDRTHEIGKRWVGRAEGEVRAEETFPADIADGEYYKSLSKQSQQYGLALIIVLIGIAVQVAANAIGWAGAYGIFGS